MRSRTALTAILVLLTLEVIGCTRANVADGDRPITLGVRIDRTTTLDGIGAGQGLSTIGDRLFAYGDAETGVLLELAPSDPVNPAAGFVVKRRVALTLDGRDAAPHPIGLAIREGYPTFLGNTVAGVGTIFTIDLDAVLEGEHGEAT